MKRRLVLLSALLLLAGCAVPPSPSAPVVVLQARPDRHAPPFARIPYEPFSRIAAVELALGEWRAFGSPVVVPNVPLPDDKERENGLWQHVGLYWWLGPDAGSPQTAWTGKHDEHGNVFPVAVNGNYAWSAAFISYLMRMAGAASRFPYSENHATYINAARRHGEGQDPNVAVTAEPLTAYAPQLGDLICEWRSNHPVTFADLPTPDPFPGHCDIVVGRQAGVLDVIGGNVDNAVSMRQIPITADGHLATPDGTVVDPNDKWFVVLMVAYDR